MWPSVAAAIEMCINQIKLGFRNAVGFYRKKKTYVKALLQGQE